MSDAKVMKWVTLLIGKLQRETVQRYRTECELDLWFRKYVAFIQAWFYDPLIVRWKLDGPGLLHSKSSPSPPVKHVKSSVDTGHLYQSHIKTLLDHSGVMRLAMWLAPVSHIFLTPCSNTLAVGLLTEPEHVFTMACFSQSSIQERPSFICQGPCATQYAELDRFILKISSCVPVAWCC